VKEKNLDLERKVALLAIDCEESEAKNYALEAEKNKLEDDIENLYKENGMLKNDLDKSLKKT
jgi:FtsZ-binding cell division protein ZapB